MSSLSSEADQRSPTKKMSSAAMIFDSSRRLLLVNPTYKPLWDLPGGVVELGESPEGGLVREVREELGVSVSVSGVLCVDYIPSDWEGMELVLFLFEAKLHEASAGRLSPNPVEIAECGFFTTDRALTLVTARMRLRILSALRALEGTPVEFLRTSDVCGD